MVEIAGSWLARSAAAAPEFARSTQAIGCAPVLHRVNRLPHIAGVVRLL